MVLQRFLSFPRLFLIIILFLCSCEPQNLERVEENVKKGIAESIPNDKISAEILPFDVTPTKADFPLVIKFSKPVAPADKMATGNFSNLTLSPSKPGLWAWWSDTLLAFTPREGWVPGEKLNLSLDRLVTSQSTDGSSLDFEPRNLEAQLPLATVTISSCKLEIKNRVPLVQTPKIELRTNYPIYEQYYDLNLSKANKTENLSAGGPLSTLSASIVGPDLFRPKEKGEIRFKLKKSTSFLKGKYFLDKEVTCNIPIGPEIWDEIADKDVEKVKEKPLTSVEAKIASFQLGESADYRTPLKLLFKTTWDSHLVSHGKLKGITLEKGISLFYGTNLIEGEWKTDINSESIISFIPKNPWPVAADLKLNIDQDIFPEIKLKEVSLSVEVPDLEYTIYDANYYTNPANNNERKFVSTLEFSHPVELELVRNLLSLRMRIEPEKHFDGKNSRALGFTFKQDEKVNTKFYVESEPVELPDEPGEIRLEISGGLIPIIGGAPTRLLRYRSVNVPSKYEIFKIESVSSSVVSNSDESMQRVLSIETSEPTREEDVLGSLEAYLLPDCSLEENSKLCKGQSEFGQEDIVFDEVLKKSQKISLSLLPRNEEMQPNLFLFSFEAHGKRELFVKVNNELQSKTNFKLKNDYRTVLFLAEFHRQLKIMHEGSLLSLSGSRKLGVSLRNVPKVQYELSRILPENVHHLVSVTYDKYSSPKFNYGSIALDQLAETTTYTESPPYVDPGKSVYTVVNFDKFLKKGKNPLGLFYLKVKEVKEESKEDESECEGEYCADQSYNECYSEDGYCPEAKLEDKRLVLLTDLGILVKNSLSGEHDIFVMSFRSGEAVNSATVKLLGQNGIPIYTKTTDINGHVQFPATKDLKNEKRPLMYVVEKGEDYSFLPYANGDRSLNFSRFDTSGIINSDEAEGLRAMLFSDRGIYRPGEEARFGIIVRKRNLEPVLSEVPLELVLTDPRGVEVLNQKFSLSKLGLDDFRWSSANSLSGTYNLSVYLVRGNSSEKRFNLGSTTFRVDEFQPDKLAVSTNYIVDEGSLVDSSAWSSSKGKIVVNVKNLFGTPAIENKVQGTLLAKPWNGEFTTYPEYLFYQQSEEGEVSREPENLGELSTDKDGKVIFIPDLSKYAEGAFNIEFAGEAFEKESGRSVLASLKTLISDSKLFLGWKVNGSLGYINKGSEREVSLLALSQDLKSIPLADITLELEETKRISTLVKQPNGTLAYELTPKKSIISSSKINVDSGTSETGGARFNLNTDEAGQFTLFIKDSTGKELNKISYTVYGDGNTSFMNDKNSEVGMKLAKDSVVPDEELEIAVNTPYLGAGFITIERDKVYALQWFKADSLSSIQKIKVPRGIVGNAYVAISFVRSIDSKEIFSSPLSYGVKPFYIAKSEYTASISLKVPEKVRPGADVEIAYELDSPGRVILYAVDEGILQFAKYKNPEPVSSFVPKRALEVSTLQILDMLLPEYSIVQSLSKTGGDEDFSLGKFKNPFSRKRRAPLAFWSGVLPEGSKIGTVKIPVPEYFNGTIRVIALTVNNTKLGVATKSFIAQNEFVIDPQAPYFVSPGDEFEIGATVANTVIGSGQDVKLSAKILQNDAIDILEDKPIEMSIPEGEDRIFRLKARAKNALGDKSYRIKVSGLGKEYSIEDSLSIRPASALRTSIESKIYRSDKDKTGSTKTLSLDRNIYSELRDVKASISYSPLTIGRSLLSYLKSYPYGCTEQLVSLAFPGVVFGNNSELGLDEKDTIRFNKRAFQALTSRQKADGSFGLWDLQSDSDMYFSVYATHFLLEANEKGFDIPSETYNRAISYLTSLVAQSEYSEAVHLSQSYALYVLARYGNVVTKEANEMVVNLDRQWQESWKGSVISLYLAGTFKILQLDEQASKLLSKLPEVWDPKMKYSQLRDPSFYGSVYSYISFKHFSEDTWLSPLDTVVPMNRMIEEKTYSSFNASYALLGLSAFSAKMSGLQESGLKLASLDEKGKKTDLEIFGKSILSSNVPLGVSKVEYAGPTDKIYFYELSQTGFDQGNLVKKEEGISVIREFRNSKKELTKEFGLEEKPEITLFIKADEALSRVAVLELLPGGFEIDLSEKGLADRKSLGESPNTWSPSFVEIQEDRIIFYGDLPANTVSFTYRLKPLSKGKFKFPAPYAEAMYDIKKRTVGEEQYLEVR